MKKIFNLLVCLFACFLVVGCSFIEDIVGEDDDDGNKYVYEYGLIYDSQKLSIGNTFEETKIVRDKLKAVSRQYRSAITTDEKGFREFLQNNTTMSAYEIEDDMSLINKYRNVIFYFYTRDHSNERIWLYVEKR